MRNHPNILIFKKKVSRILILILILPTLSYATHIVGGEMNYKYLGNNQYELHLTVYRDWCTGVPPFDDPASLGVFDSSNQLKFTFSLNLPDDDTLESVINNPCIIPPISCYHTVTYIDTLTLPLIPGGYQLVYQRCCRNDSILNILGFDPSGEDTTGATYNAFILDTAIVKINSSPAFKNWPPPFICNNESFRFDHSAEDEDNDSLVYELCVPLHGAEARQCSGPQPCGPVPNPPFNPPYKEVTWKPPFGINNMMGGMEPLRINPVNGELTVIPNQVGKYVAGICVREYRDGIFLSETRRDIQLNVVNCPKVTVASLQAPQLQCGNLSVAFDNNSINAEVYSWNFGDTSILNDTSDVELPNYTYPDTGQYRIRLIAKTFIPQTGKWCIDSSFSDIYLKNTSLNVDFIVLSDSCNPNRNIQCTDLSSDPDYGIAGREWDFGDNEISNDTNPIHTYQDIGTYTLQLVVTSSNRCIDTLQKKIKFLPVPVAGFKNDEGCLNAPVQFSDTSFVLNDSIVNYTWDFDDGNQAFEKNPTHIFTTLDSFNVSLIVQAKSGCRDTSVKKIKTSKLPVANFNFSTPCAIDTVSFFDQSVSDNGLLNYWYWRFGNGDTSLLQNPRITYINSKNYPVYLFVSDSNGCKDSIERSVFLYPKPMAGFQTENVCISSPNQFNDTSSVDQSSIVNTIIEYRWDFGDGDTSVIKNPVHTYSDTGNFSVRLNVGTNFGCLDTITNLIRVYPIPKANAGKEVNICFGNSTKLNAQGGVNYVWNPITGLDNPNTSNPLARPSITTQYTVKVTDNNNCSDIDSVVINVLPLPEAKAGNDLWLCTSGDSVSLQGSGGDIYIWAPSSGLADPMASETKAKPSISTLYMLTVIDSNNCIDQDIMEIQVGQFVPVSAGKDLEFCIGNSGKLGGNPTAPVNSQIAWSPAIGLDNINLPNPIATIAITTTYIVTATNDLCFGSDTITLVIDTIPEVRFFAEPVCLNQPTKFIDSSTVDSAVIVSWEWKFGDGDSSTFQNPQHIYTNPGKYFVTLKVNCSKGCTNSKTDIVEVYSLPSLASSIIDSITCYKKCDGSITAIGSNAMAPYTYSWEGGLTNPFNAGLCAGNHTLTVTDTRSCARVNTFTLIEPKPLALNINKTDANCNGICTGKAEAVGSGGNGVYSFQWSDPVGLTSSTNSNLCPGEYFVTLTDSKKCTLRDTVNINSIISEPILKISADRDTLYLGESTLLHATATKGYIYEWLPEDGLTSATVSDPGVKPLSTTLYYLNITDSNGCKKTDSLRIMVKNVGCMEPEIFIPNAFTPNGDNHNDLLFVRGNTIQEMYLAVFNRWGEMVFESTDKNKGWDGMYNGKESEAGVYVYYLTLTCVNKEKILKKGNITIIR